MREWVKRVNVMDVVGCPCSPRCPVCPSCFSCAGSGLSGISSGVLADPVESLGEAAFLLESRSQGRQLPVEQAASRGDQDQRSVGGKLGKGGRGGLCGRCGLTLKLFGVVLSM